MGVPLICQQLISGVSPFLLMGRMFLNVRGGRETKSSILLPHTSQIQIMFVSIHFKLHSPIFGEAKTLPILKKGQLVLIELFCFTSYSFVANISLDHPTQLSYLSLAFMHLEPLQMLSLLVIAWPSYNWHSEVFGAYF